MDRALTACLERQNSRVCRSVCSEASLPGFERSFLFLGKLLDPSMPQSSHVGNEHSSGASLIGSY